ncbi:MAG: CsbD family protein [Terriglobia bacterium]|nr:CsbD family protein [Terriglobia bacterium]
MKAGIKDELKGKAHQVKGAIKETAGKVINNPRLEAKGHHERVAGKVQKKIGQVEKVFEK